MKTVNWLKAGLVAAVMTPVAALAADKTKDPYIAGFENYAKENPELAGAMQAYVKDLEKAVQQDPKLKFKPHGESH